MATSTFDQRTNTIAQIWRDNRWLYLLMGFGLGVLALPALQMINNDTAELLTGLVPEAVGIVFTVLIIERFARVRARRELKDQLFFELGSNEHGTAMRALRLLQHKNWIDEGNLKGGDWSGANWVGVKLPKFDLSEVCLRGAMLEKSNLREVTFVRSDLFGVNLTSANLEWANLENADLAWANLKNANLYRANLVSANLRDVNLASADLLGANLANVDLSGGNLKGAILSGANLKSAILLIAQLDEQTVLPDASDIGAYNDDKPTYDKYWTPNTDMSRYTDPHHFDFWQPEWAAAGYENYDDWEISYHPTPWIDAGYDDWNEWVRDGKPTARDES